MIVDYLWDLKADLYAITETWLTEKDAAVRAELALDGYNVGTTFVKAEMLAALGSYTVMHCEFRKLKLESERQLNFQSGSSAPLSHNFRLFIEFSHDVTVAIYWCPKTMKRRPCWCLKAILWKLNSFVMQTLSFV